LNKIFITKHLRFKGIPIIFHDNIIAKERKIAIILHGGPFFHYDKTITDYDVILGKNNFSILKINYPGSTGYGKKYKEEIYKNGGLIDISAIHLIVDSYIIDYDYSIIVGDSYGGFLATLCSVLCNCNLVIATNAFVSIDYQVLFSVERDLMRSLFSLKSLDFTKIYSNNISSKLYIINGTNDLSCPFPQLLPYRNKKNIKIIELEKTHFDFGIDKIIQKNIYRYLSNDDYESFSSSLRKLKYFS
jgi:alpha/beta superfamily hydrolase